MSLRIVALEREVWPLRAPFRIARGTRETAEVIHLRLARDGVEGHAECFPYPRYGETSESVVTQIEAGVAALGGGGRRDLLDCMPAGAARNAVDCALWDLECKAQGVRSWELAGLPRPGPVVTVMTVVLDSPEAMRAAAERNAGRPVLKIKLDAHDVLARVRAVRAGAPRSRLVVDANESWSLELLRSVMPELGRLGVEMIEQPLPADADGVLEDLPREVPLCADESCHTRRDLAACRGLYDLVNVKLDKTGGLTEALAMASEAARLGFGLMVGCMLGTSLAMAPATLIAGAARVVDLDGPLWLAADRAPALDPSDGCIGVPEAELWG